MITQNYINQLTYEILGAAIEVHRELGPGLLESVYEKCLVHLLKQKQWKVVSQMRVPILFRGLYLEEDLRFDILAEDLIIVECKSSDQLKAIHEAQLRTYLKLLKKPKGILINFNCVNIFREGQKTIVTEYFAMLPKGY
jgi:GxxExxY protein